MWTESFSTGKSDAERQCGLPCRTAYGSGATQVDAAFRPENKGPDFSLTLKIENTEMRAMNDVFRAYGNFDVDHLNWELIAEVAKKIKGEEGKALKEAHEQVEEEEDHHLYHTTGWGRELWIQSLGLPAVIPPPEEEKDVKTAIGAARAKQSRNEML